jgi:broad specificity phosphatase PhoE
MVLNSNPFAALEHDADFWLVRHGQSAGNHEGRVQGTTDLPLTDKGIEEARVTGHWFSHHHMDLVATSPLVRARLTAETIKEAAGWQSLPFTVRQDLVELDTGLFSNRTFREIQAEDPDIYHQFQSHSWQAVPGAEPVDAIQARALGHWRWLVDQANEGKRRILSVTHFGMLQWLWKTSMHQQWNSWFPLVSVGNCGVFHLHASPRESKAGKTCYLEWRLVNHRPAGA